MIKNRLQSSVKFFLAKNSNTSSDRREVQRKRQGFYLWLLNELYLTCLLLKMLKVPTEKCNSLD